MLRVFIADDSRLVRERLGELIGDLEAVEVIGQANDAPAALDAVHQLRPDVLILDIRMPGGSGVKALEVIKGHVSAPVVIMLTAFPYPQYRKRCLDAGADYFFDKTTEFDRVAEVLAQLKGLTRDRPESLPRLRIGKRHQ